MKARLVLSLVLCFAASIVIAVTSTRSTYSQTKKNAPTLSQPEQDLLNEINQVRAHPQVYATYLEKMRPMFNGKSYKPDAQDSFDTQEGWAAVEDAIKFLKAAKPIGPLNASQGLYLAALSHVKDQSSTGATGHRGNDSTLIEERVKPYGTWQGGIGENLTYGNESARERVLTWLIDDGFAGRGHRNRLMSSNYNVAGVSCGPHPEYGSMCVVTLAGGFVDVTTSNPSTGAGSTSKNRPANAQISTTTNSNSKSNTTNSNAGKAKPRKM